MSMKVKGRVAVDPSRGGRTRQSEAAACDVNLIVAQHRRGGVTAHTMQRVAEYGFVPAATFQDCMDQVRRAQEVFNALPSATREFFSNDPARFVDYVSKPENQAELQKHGLLVPREQPVPVLGSAENPIVTRSVEPAAPG